MKRSANLLLSLLVVSSVQAEDYELGNKIRFENTIDAHSCSELTIKNKSIGYVFDVVEVSDTLVFRMCEKYKPHPAFYVGEGNIYGGVKEGWYIVNTPSHSPAKLKLPMLMNYSNPSYCGQYIAYWGNENNNKKWYGTVIDLNSNKQIEKVYLGEIELETDYMYHLKRPKWTENCSSVKFNDPRHIEEKNLTIRSSRDAEKRRAP